jgi:hypothetical protein
MAQGNALIADTLSPDSDSGVRLRRSVHPLLAAIEQAPLDPISDEENAQLDEILRTTTHWLTDEEFAAAVGL